MCVAESEMLLRIHPLSTCVCYLFFLRADFDLEKVRCVEDDRETVAASVCKSTLSKICGMARKILLHMLPVSPVVQSALFAMWA